MFLGLVPGTLYDALPNGYWQVETLGLELMLDCPPSVLVGSGLGA